MSYPDLNIVEFLVRTKQLISLLLPCVSFLSRVPLFVDSLTWFVNIDGTVCSLFEGQSLTGKYRYVSILPWMLAAVERIINKTFLGLLSVGWLSLTHKMLI